MTGWVYIILSATASLLIAHLLKMSESRGLSTIRVLTINYLIAAVAAFVFSDFSQLPKASADLVPVLLLSLLVGVIFILNFFVYSKSVYQNGIGISIAVMRVSLVTPVLLSTLVYGELISIRQIVGISLVFVILFLLIPDKKGWFKGPLKAGSYLLILFIGTGIGDSSLKIFEMEFLQLLPKELFMGFVFLTSFFCGIVMLLRNHSWQFQKREIAIGTMIGIPNLLTSVFMISALQVMNGAIVFSAVNLITVAAGTLLGVLYWKDRFLSSQWLGIFLTIVALLLLI